MSESSPKTLRAIDILIPNAAELPAGADREALQDDVLLHLAIHAPQGWQEIDWQAQGATIYRLHVVDDAAGAAVQAGVEAAFPMLPVMHSTVQDQDWTAAWRQFFTPVRAGGLFTILPPWLADEPDEGRINLVIEPNMAFGTGHHPTTNLCLAVLGEAHAAGSFKAGGRFLDVGTGTGILGLGLVKLGLEGVAIDIDPQATERAAENLALNHLPKESMAIAATTMDGIAPSERFDVIAANILAGPLVELAPRLTQALAPGGVLVLSGILTTQAEDVTKAYLDCGLTRSLRRDLGDWTAMVFMGK